MTETWIKLYRKAMEHPVFRDESAWRVWTWILLSVNYETGEMTFGRFKTSEALNISPSKFRHIIDRLRSKYDLIETTNQHSHTKLTVKNWHKYQAQSDSIVDNLELGPEVRPQERPQAENDIRPQDIIEKIPQQEQEQDNTLDTRPQERPQGIQDVGPQPEATQKATIQEYKNNKEIKKDNINNSSYEELQEIAGEAHGEVFEQPCEKPESVPLEGEVVNEPKEKKPVKKKSERNSDGSFGNVDINEGIATLTELLGEKPEDLQLNKYALRRLYVKRTKERTLKAIRYAFYVRQTDKFAPRIFNYIELEKKWVRLEEYAKDNPGGTVPSYNKTRSSPSRATYDNVVGGIAW